MQCLIVDDSAAVRTIIRRALQTAGIPGLEIKMAVDGVGALALMETFAPDIVLSDIHMPGMSGIDLLRQIRHSFSADLRVGFLTTETDSEFQVEASRLGASFFIKKPFQNAELLSAIQRAFDGGVPTTGLAQVASVGHETEVSDEGNNEAQLLELPVAIVTLADLPKVTRLIGSAVQHRLDFSLMSPTNADDLRFPSSVSLYVFEHAKEVRGMCLIDKPGLDLLNAVITKPATPPSLLIARKTPQHSLITAEILMLLGEEVCQLFASSDGRRLSLAKTQMMQKDVPQLRDIMRRSPKRCDFAITRAHYPSGRMTLISK
jgi:CheY-like chemotaxis protein